MVCIIDDREDVWNFASNLIHVKPYQFFKGVGDINAPPGSTPTPEEGSTSLGEPVNVEDIQGGDVKTEEVNSVENKDTEEQEKNDAVFEGNSKPEDIECQEASEEKRSVENSGENLEACEKKQEPVYEICVGENNITKAVVDTSEDSSKVLENGGNDEADNETEKIESNETKVLSENNQEGEQDNNGKTEGVEEKNLSDCDVEMACEAAQLRCEGGKCCICFTFPAGVPWVRWSHLSICISAVHNSPYSMFHSFHGLMNSINWPACHWGKYCCANAEATGLNPVEATKSFFRANFAIA